MSKQRTLKNAVKASGIGVHSGDTIHITLHPAEENTGIVFRRVDFASPHPHSLHSRITSATQTSTPLLRKRR